MLYIFRTVMLSVMFVAIISIAHNWFGGAIMDLSKWISMHAVVLLVQCRSVPASGIQEHGISGACGPHTALHKLVPESWLGEGVAAAHPILSLCIFQLLGIEVQGVWRARMSSAESTSPA